MLVTGRIATLAGDAGMGWVEAIGVRDGRVAFAGSEVDLETRADPHTERIALEPDQVAIPGLTDAHLHLVQAALAARQVDLTAAATVPEGMAAVARAHVAAPDPEAWLLGHGWDVGRWGRWPTAADLEAVAPGRRVALWAHDHHALLASEAALALAGIDRDRADPGNGVIRRGSGGSPEGALLEGAASLVASLIPAPSEAELEAAIAATGRDFLEVGLFEFQYRFSIGYDV
jgi:predicted amidohydrolase YtcJ